MPSAGRQGREGDEQFVPMDDPMREMLEFITGKKHDEKNVDRRALARMPITENLMLAFAWEALAPILYRMRRGSFQASKLMLGYALGQPEKPYREQIRGLTLEEAKAEYMRLAEAEVGVDGEKAGRLLQRRLADRNESEAEEE